MHKRPMGLLAEITSFEMNTIGQGRLFSCLWALSFLLLSRVAAGDSIQGCGGFVEGSAALARLRRPSDPKLDYSHMTVELHTLDGLIKDSTQCAPNGYYYIPVYDRGTFVLKIKGPDGWSFDPEKVTVVVDHNGCNNNDDINFRYTGFAISGRVLGASGGASCSEEDGPAGVDVTIERNDDHFSVKFTTVTSPGGSYKFLNLAPGRYKLSAHHSKWNVQVNGVPEIDLGWSNGVVGDVFSIAGYDIDGTVVSQGNPVLGVEVYLYSDDVREIPCAEGSIDSSPIQHKKALCRVVSDVNGRFKFFTVPCGRYQLVPFYKGDTTVFDISPSSVNLHVVHDSVEISQPFQVTGFSVKGRVVDSQGAGVEGVTIFIDDEERSTTDSHGHYKLDQVTSTHYNIKARKPSYTFSTLDKFMVLPNMALIPDIKASLYAVCGSLNVLSPEHTGVRQVALTHGPANVKPQTKRTDELGQFCFDVPPGDYRLSPLTTSTEILAGLLFAPPYLDLSVNKPITDALFVQAQVSVYGSVKCKASCSSKVVISLTSLSPSTSARTDVSKVKYARLREDDETFSFQKVLPGKYQLQVTHEPLTQGSSWDDEWCWEQKSLVLEVGIEDVHDVTFVQKGYLLHIKSTHDASAFTLNNQKEANPLQVKKGWQEVCLMSPGIHELHFLWPCVYFGAFSFRVNTSVLEPLQLVGEKFVLSGHLNVDSVQYPDANSLADSIFVDIGLENGDAVAHTVHVQLIAEANGTHPVAVYKYAHWAQLGDKLTITPRHGNRNSGVERLETNILFYPRDQKFYVETDGCQPEIPVFSGRPGVYVSGTVAPPLAGVNLSIIAQGSSVVGRLNAGELVAWTLTGEDGTFSAGPLYDDTTYKVLAEKAGYYLKDLGDNIFSCQKLGKINVKILRGEGAEESIPAVLLSLSGDDGYRKNAATGTGGGFTFDNLFPGSFYLRPLLKEYSFTPAAQAIEVSSDEFKEVTFTARRIAYSVGGLITFLSGKSAEGVVLEARSARGYYEETTSDADGRYRLRGLQPNTTYTVRAVSKEDTSFKLERASPAATVLKVGDNDTYGLNFLVFEETPLTIVTGSVEGPDLERWQPQIEVEFVLVSDPYTVVRSVPLPLAYFFEIQGLPSGTYLVQLSFGSAKRTHKFNSSTIELDLSSKGCVHLGSLTFTAEEKLHSQELTRAPVVPVFVGITVIAIFASLPRLKDGYQWAVGSSGSGAVVTGSKKEVAPKKFTVRTKRAL